MIFVAVDIGGTFTDLIGFDDEAQAFENFARARPKNLILLIDTYDTEAAARKVVALAPRLKAAGIAIAGVRLDSGDLIALSRSVRRILDDGGTPFVHSGQSDQNAVIDFYGRHVLPQLHV